MKALTKTEKTYVLNKLKEWKISLSGERIDAKAILEVLLTNEKVIALKEALLNLTGISESQLVLSVGHNPNLRCIYLNIDIDNSYNVMVPTHIYFNVTSLLPEETINEIFKFREAYKVIDAAIKGDTMHIDLEKYFLNFSLQKAKVAEREEKIEELINNIKEAVLKIVA